MERSMVGLILWDRVTNEELHRTRIVDVIECIIRLKWKWAGYVARLKNGRWVKKILEWAPRADKCSWGRPPTRWTDDLKWILTNWIAIAQDRGNWKCLEEAYVQQWTQLAVWRDNTILFPGKNDHSSYRKFSALPCLTMAYFPYLEWQIPSHTNNTPYCASVG